MADTFIHIQKLDLPELRVFSGLSENELLHFFEPEKEGLFVAESPNVVLRALEGGYEPYAFLLAENQLEAAGEVLKRSSEAPVYVASEELLKNITGFPMTRGVLCAFHRKKLPEAAELLQGKRRIAVLENVMNPTNLGAIFRSAAALGMEAVLFTKGSADPLYRRASRVSMGTVFQVPWTYIEDVKEVQSLGFKTAAMALRLNTVSIKDPALQQEERLAVVLGTEGEGLKEETILSADYTIKIPMAAGVDSLNVAAASAVAFWELGLHD